MRCSPLPIWSSSIETRKPRPEFGRGKRKDARYAPKLVALHGQPLSKSASLPTAKDSICRVPGHWAKEGPNRQAPCACYKCKHLGHWATLPHGSKDAWVRTVLQHAGDCSGLINPPPVGLNKGDLLLDWSQGCKWMWQEGQFTVFPRK